MALYLLQFTYTTEAWTKLVNNPQDREKSIRQLAERLGSKIVGFYYTHGEYDGIVILDAPEDETANALVFAATTAGHIKSTKTSRLYTMEEILSALKKAHDINYSAPSGIRRT